MFYPPNCPFCNSKNIYKEYDLYFKCISVVHCENNNLYEKLTSKNHKYKIVFGKNFLSEELMIVVVNSYIIIKNRINTENNEIKSEIIVYGNKNHQEEFDKYIDIENYNKYLIFI